MCAPSPTQTSLVIPIFTIRGLRPADPNMERFAQWLATHLNSASFQQRRELSGLAACNPHRIPLALLAAPDSGCLHLWETNSGINITQAKGEGHSRQTLR